MNGIKRAAARLICAWMICLICLAAFPKGSRAVADYTMDFSQNVLVSWHGGRMINFQDTDDSDTGWSWDASEKTLTLDGLRFATLDPTALKLPAGATLLLTAGSSNVFATSYVYTGAVLGNYGIWCDGNLTVTGSGSLEVSVSDPFYGGGIHTQGSLTVSGAHITVRSILAGIDSTGAISLSNGAVIDSRSTTQSGVITDYSGAISVTGGSSLTGVSSENHAFGVDSGGAITVTGAGSRLRGVNSAIDAFAAGISTFDTITGFITEPSGGVAANHGFNQIGPRTTVLTRVGGVPAMSATVSGTPAIASDIPHTGDDAPIAALCGLILICGAGLALGAATGRRAKRQ